MADDNLDHFLSLIIPVYKQEATIVRNIREIKQALDKIRYPYELIVVIDGLIDKSYDKLKKAKIPNAKIIVYKKNHGKSYAIRAGMNKAKGDYVMFIDSGMEIDPNGISMLLEHMEWYNADIIVGSKRHPASLINYSRSRRILSFGYYYLVRLLFGVNVRDIQAGIKIFKKELIKKVLPRLVEKRFAGDLEILVVAKTLGYHRIFEAPIKLDYKLGKITSAANLTAIWKILFDTLAIFYRSRILKSYNQSLKNK